MLGKYEYNEILFHMDQNISEAILIALEDSARIYVEVNFSPNSPFTKLKYSFFLLYNSYFVIDLSDLLPFNMCYLRLH